MTPNENQYSNFSLASLPRLLVPIAILVVGWLVALAIGRLVQAGLKRTHLGDRLARSTVGEDQAQRLDAPRLGGKIAYYVVLAFVVLGFFQSLHWTAATEPIRGMLGGVFEYVPRILGAAAVLLVGWMVATLVRRMLSAGARRFDLDTRFKRETMDQPVSAIPGEGAPTVGHEISLEPHAAAPYPTPRPASVESTIGQVGYWLVLLLFLPAVLGVLRLDGILGPVRAMMDKAMGFLPNIVSAGVIFAVGWLVARVCQRLVTNLAAGLGVDRLSERAGGKRLLGSRSPSSLVGLIVYALILIPVAIAALNALKLDAITTPASAMLQRFLAAVPALFGAALVLAIAGVVARFVGGIVSRLLEGAGFDRVFERMGVSQPTATESTPSSISGKLVMAAIMVFAIMEAAGMLGFGSLSNLTAQFAALAGHILLGLVIFGVGLYLARVAGGAVERSNLVNRRFLAQATQAAVIVLAGAIGLRQMGVANEIIELAFALLLGSISVAAAIAFGLGGRDAAAKALERMRVRAEEMRIQTPPAQAQPGPVH